MKIKLPPIKPQYCLSIDFKTITNGSFCDEYDDEEILRILLKTYDATI
jgi:hypothetical protein